MCDEDDGYVFWNETQRCYRVYTKGPCPANAWLIPSEAESEPNSSTTKKKKEVFCECRSGFHFDPDSYTCKRSLNYPLALYGETSSWAQQLQLMERLQQMQQRRKKQQEQTGIAWTRGVFVSGGTTLALPLTTTTTPLPPPTTEDEEFGWGAKALPRVGRRLGEQQRGGGGGQTDQQQQQQNRQQLYRRRRVRTGILAGRRRVLRT